MKISKENCINSIKIIKGKFCENLRKNKKKYMYNSIFINQKMYFIFHINSSLTSKENSQTSKYPHIDICYIYGFVSNNHPFCICIEFCTVGIDSERLESATQFCMWPTISAIQITHPNLRGGEHCLHFLEGKKNNNK